jgi:gamma-glutamylcyclotransferase (GGCT)/AIG2-like uncharacterized protein YtfP
MKNYYVFVYGTLRQYERNHHLLEEATCMAKQCWTYGILYNTGLGYPAMVKDPTKRVYGELYKVNKEQLKRLDLLEGYSGKGKLNHYERVTETVFTDFGMVQAEMYVYPPANATHLKEITFGDWKCHQYLAQSNLLYFSYGSCMDDQRFYEAGVHDQFHDVVGCGVARNYSLAYSRKSVDGGRADLIESDQWVEGKVYQIKAETLRYLFKREGVNLNIYRPAFIDVEINGVTHYHVLTFLVIDKSEETAPPECYAAEILRGAKGFVSQAYYNRLLDDLNKKFEITL